MKYIVFISCLLGYLTTTCTLAACTTGALVTTHSSQEVCRAIEGEYVVYCGEDLVLTGHLNLSNGEYAFTPQVGVDADVLSAANSRFFFIQYQMGTYHVEYYGLIRSDTVLDNLENDEILLTIMFDAAGTENHVPNPVRDTDQVFLIRTDIEGSRLYFHSTVSEFELWCIEK